MHTNNNMWSDDQRRDLSINQAGSCLRLYIADDQESKDSAFNLRSPEDYHQITAALESHALALGWISETREAEVARLKAEVVAMQSAGIQVRAQMYADVYAKQADEISKLNKELAYCCDNNKDLMKARIAEKFAHEDKLETLRATIEQWKTEAEAQHDVDDSPSETNQIHAEVAAYDKVLRLLAGNAAGEGEGEI